MEIIKNYSKKIYKKDSKDKIRVLHVYTDGADLVQESGLLDGKLVTHSSTCTGKNIGRSNETTPEEQAISEAISKIETKMTEGYFESAEDAEEKGGNKVILPMLAKSYEKEIEKVNWKKAVFIQPKLDGMRCLAILKDGEVTLISRKGKIIDTVPHINNALVELSNTTDVVLDGELYAHGKTFQENMRLLKKNRGSETEEIIYHVYDTVSDQSYINRYDIIKNIVEQLEVNAFETLKVELVSTAFIDNVNKVKDFHSLFLGQGYEGSIIRHGSSGYDINKRSSSLLKVKDFIDQAYPIVDVVPSERRPEQGVIVCEVMSGNVYPKIFHANLKFSHAEREEILKNKDKYIGQMAEIRFFEFTEDRIPRFPVCVGFRLDK
jgi:DNA ligase-1